jgi:hypothetical protein
VGLFETTLRVDFFRQPESRLRPRRNQQTQSSFDGRPLGPPRRLRMASCINRSSMPIFVHMRAAPFRKHLILMYPSMVLRGHSAAFASPVHDPRRWSSQVSAAATR